MSVEFESAKRLTALKSKADAVTGETSSTLADAVDAIIAGYGQGGDDESVGVFVSGFTGSYNLPSIADIRSIPVPPSDKLRYHEHFIAHMFANVNKNGNGGYWVELREVYLPDGLLNFSANAFAYCSKLTTVHGDLSTIKNVGDNAFTNCLSLTELPYMPNLTQIGGNAFAMCTGLSRVKLYDTATSIKSNAFNGCINIADIYVPWAEGEVANAPWGATNATIHYNTVYDENHDPIV